MMKRGGKAEHRSKLTPQRHAHGLLISKRERHPSVKGRVRRWAKRIIKRRLAQRQQQEET